MPASEVVQEFKIRSPDDFHLHLRDGELMNAVLPFTSRHFARALVMPNLDPPITTVLAAKDYGNRIIDALRTRSNFIPLLTLYLTETTTPEDIKTASSSGIIHAVKLYPAHATTNSESGVREFEKLRPTLDAMEEHGLTLSVHGEYTSEEVDVFDRESAFIDRVMVKFRKWNPNLRIAFEHITTADAVEFVRDQWPLVAGTITLHHLILNRSHLFEGGLRPHRFCFPLPKRDYHRRALVSAATSREKCFFLGTDSAPHLNSRKLTSCGCAGIFTAPIALTCLVQLFDDIGQLDALEAFVSEFGARFYRLPLNTSCLNLLKQSESTKTAPTIGVGKDEIEVFDPGFPIYWTVK